MTQLSRFTTTLSISLFTLHGPAFAQTLLSGNHSVDGALCAGSSCTGSESFIGADFKIKAFDPELLFEDVSGSSDPDRDWRILTNENGLENFLIEDVTTERDVFGIEGNAPANSLYVSANGQIGLGTSLPQEELHIFDLNSPGIRFDVGSSSQQEWSLIGSASFFYVENDTDGTFPFVIDDSAPDRSMWINASGDLGLGLSAPQGKLHTRGTGVQLAYFESSDGGPVQVRFRTDSENRRFLATNNADEVQSQIIFGDDNIRFTGETDSGANLWLTISSAGIVSQGPTCNPGPCDATFDPQAFEVPSIEDHAAYMWENQHLWGVGPTSADEPFNITQKAGGMLHEIEVAHIYIDQLNSALQDERGRNDAQSRQIEAQADLIAQLMVRLEAVEAQ